MKPTANKTSTVNRQPSPSNRDAITAPKKLIHSIVQGDCLEKLPKIPDNFVDFVCADFPYNISGRPGLTMRGNRIVRADFGEWDKWPSQDQYLDFVFEVCRQLHRVMQPNASAVLFF